MEDLKVIELEGGLEVQLFQYAFLRFIEIQTGQVCWVDDSSFFDENVRYLGCELEHVFGVKLHKLSSFFSEDVWEELVRQKKNGHDIPEQLRENGLELTLITEQKNSKYEGEIVTIQSGEHDLLEIPGIVYYQGQFAHFSHAETILETLRSELTFPPLKHTMERDTVNKLYEEMMLLTDSVAVSIRNRRHIPVVKYAHRIRSLERSKENATYFIFSDDISWCKNNLSKLGLEHVKGDVFFVEENGDDNKYYDMQLMGMCKTVLLDRSAFAIWSCYLSGYLSTMEIIDLDDTK